MKVMLAEYSVCTQMEGPIRKEGAAMLATLREAFVKAGCTVRVPTDFEGDFLEVAKASDCGLVIAPDDLLAGFTRTLEACCLNLGSSPAVVSLCTDKLETTAFLLHNGIPAPRIIARGEGKCVVKPRYGCASEGIFISAGPVEKAGFISTEFIDGEHLSVTLVGGKSRALPLTLNRQRIRLGETVVYDGNDVNVAHPAAEEIVGTARQAGEAAGCRGLFGVDIVYGGRPYVVDINARPTTPIVGVSRVIDRSLADLVLAARFGALPEAVGAAGSYSFNKRDLEEFL